MLTSRHFALAGIALLLAASMTLFVRAQDAADSADAAAAQAEEELPPADVAGEWTYSFEGFGGTVDVTITLEQDGSKLTGSVSGFGGESQGISNGKVNGKQVTFQTTRNFGDQTATTTYTGTVENDTFTGQTATVFTRDFEAKRDGEAEAEQPAAPDA